MRKLEIRYHAWLTPPFPLSSTDRKRGKRQSGHAVLHLSRLQALALFVSYFLAREVAGAAVLVTFNCCHACTGPGEAVQTVDANAQKWAKVLGRDTVFYVSVPDTTAVQNEFSFERPVQLRLGACAADVSDLLVTAAAHFRHAGHLIFVEPTWYPQELDIPWHLDESMMSVFRVLHLDGNVRWHSRAVNVASGYETLMWHNGSSTDGLYLGTNSCPAAAVASGVCTLRMLPGKVIEDGLLDSGHRYDQKRVIGVSATSIPWHMYVMSSDNLLYHAESLLPHEALLSDERIDSAIERVAAIWAGHQPPHCIANLPDLSSYIRQAIVEEAAWITRQGALHFPLYVGILFFTEDDGTEAHVSISDQESDLEAVKRSGAQRYAGGALWRARGHIYREASPFPSVGGARSVANPGLKFTAIPPREKCTLDVVSVYSAARLALRGDWSAFHPADCHHQGTTQHWRNMTYDGIVAAWSVAEELAIDHLLESPAEIGASILISYADQCCWNSQPRLMKSALEVGGFDKVISYGPLDMHDDFVRQVSSLLSETSSLERPGSASYVWKPYLAVKTLFEAKRGEVVCYSDSGAYFVESAAPLLRFTSQVPLGIYLYTQLDPSAQEARLSKRDAFLATEMDLEGVPESMQVSPSFISCFSQPSDSLVFARFSLC
jgi:hypothetical protein